MKTTYAILLFFTCGLTSFVSAQDASYFVYSPTNRDLLAGSSQDATYSTRKAFEATSFSFAGNRNPVYGFGTPSIPGNPSFEQGSVILTTDRKAYHSILSLFVQGTKVAEMNIDGVSRSGGGAPDLVFSEMIFKDIVITSLEIEATQGDVLFVRMTFDWEAMSMQFFTQNPSTGTRESVGAPVLWNRTDNTATF